MIDSQVMTLIINSLEPQLSEGFYYCETTTELWKKKKSIQQPKRTFSSISVQARNYKYHTRITRHTRVNRACEIKI
jgi:hypothetical protein